MKLVMTLLVRDEADIVAANVDYHLAQGVDFVIATDHSSRDGTAEVLRAYERDGVLSLREAAGAAHDQVTHVNAMARAAATDYGADWVINNDADEFWWPLSGNLKELLKAVPDEIGVLVASRSNFLPRPIDTGTFAERLIVRETASTNGLGEPLEPKVVHRATPEIEMAPGNHSVQAPDLNVAPDLGLLEVLHFPMRSFEQFERKVLNVGIGYEQLQPREPDVGRDQLALLALHREGRLRAHYDSLVMSDSDLEEAIARGAVVVDTRLRDFLSGRGSGGQVPPGPPAEKLIWKGLELAVELDGARRDLAAARAARAHLQEELEVAQRELQAAHASREHAERRLASTDAALRALQTSRLVRYSQPVRKLFYRLGGRA